MVQCVHSLLAREPRLARYGVEARSSHHEPKSSPQGAQRFGESGYYDRKIPKLLELARDRRTEGVHSDPRGVPHETTYGPPSCMAPDVGDRLADAAIELVREMWR